MIALAMASVARKMGGQNACAMMALVEQIVGLARVQKTAAAEESAAKISNVFARVVGAEQLVTDHSARPPLTAPGTASALILVATADQGGKGTRVSFQRVSTTALGTGCAPRTARAPVRSDTVVQTARSSLASADAVAMGAASATARRLACASAMMDGEG